MTTYLFTRIELRSFGEQLGCLYENRRAEKHPVLFESLSIEFPLVVRHNSSILR